MRMVTLCFGSWLVLALAGCIPAAPPAQQPTSAEQEQSEGAKVVYQPEPGLTAKERWKKAIDLLQVGESGPARAELVAYLGEKPTSNRARDLIKQIDSDPVAYLGEKFFLYRMESGDSISIVAKRMLGDALKFHALARYNDIENPSKIVAGQVIKVPGDEPPPQLSEETPETASAAGLDSEEAQVDSGQSPSLQSEGTPEEVEEAQTGAQAADETSENPTMEVAVATDEPAPVEDEADALERLMQQAVAKVQQGDYGGASNDYEAAVAQFPGENFIKQMAALNYLTYADTLETEGDREKASLILVRARQLDPKNDEIRQRLGLYARLDEADGFYQEGTGHQAKGDLIAAYGSFQKALKVVPDHNLANKKLLSLTPAVAEAYYRKGLKAYRGQDLDEAIAMFDQCLSVDPGSSSCSVKRIEAAELKERYENLPPPE